MSDRRTRFGVIGLSTTGWAAQALIPPLLTAPLSSAYELRAVCTTKQSSAEATAKKYSEITGGPVKAYWDPQLLCTDPELDMVIVSVKSPLQFQNAKLAIENGKDVFVECPAGNGQTEIKILADLIQEKKVKAMFGLQGMHGNVFKKVREASMRHSFPLTIVTGQGNT